MKRQVYVVEGRRKGEIRESRWCVQQAYYSKRKACAGLRMYRDWQNPGHEFRITTYVPKESK